MSSKIPPRLPNLPPAHPQLVKTAPSKPDAVAAGAKRRPAGPRSARAADAADTAAVDAFEAPHDAQHEAHPDAHRDNAGHAGPEGHALPARAGAQVAAGSAGSAGPRGGLNLPAQGQRSFALQARGRAASASGEPFDTAGGKGAKSVAKASAKGLQPGQVRALANRVLQQFAEAAPERQQAAAEVWSVLR